MKKHRPYNQTAAGVRISKHKIKWMTSPEDETTKSTKSMDISPYSGRTPLNLYIHNLNLLLQITDSQAPTEVIDVTDWQGGEKNDA